MDINKTIIVSGYEGRTRFLSGVKQAVDILNSTLSGHGLAVMYESDYNRRVDVSDDEYNSQAPTSTSDGVKIASKIVLDDPIEDLGAQALFEVAKQQNTEAGDGTTTAPNMYYALINAVYNKLNEGGELSEKMINRRQLVKDLIEVKDEIIEILKTKAKPIKTYKELENISLTAGQYENIDKAIAEAWWKVGKDGWVGVEGHKGFETEIDVIEGMRINAKMMSEYMRTEDNGEMEVKNTLVLVTNHDINDIPQIQNISQLAIYRKKFEVILFAPKFSLKAQEAMNALMDTVNKTNIANYKANKKERAIRLFGVAIPTLTEKEGGQAQDLAIFTGSKFIDKNKSMTMENVEAKDLGSADKIICDGKVAILGGGAGDTKKRVKELTKQMREEKDDFFKKRLQNRIGALSSGMATVKAGATTDTERRYIKLKADDTVYACRNAMQEGYIAGAGQVLRKLPCENEYLKAMLDSPYNTIRENAGGIFTVPKEIVDPVFSVITAIERAVSMAGMVIVDDTFIAYDRTTLIDVLERIANELKNLKK